jgi:hypothetical protein
MLGITGDIQIGRIMRRPRSELALRGWDCGPSPMLNHNGSGGDKEGGRLRSEVFEGHYFQLVFVLTCYGY